MKWITYKSLAQFTLIMTFWLLERSKEEGDNVINPLCRSAPEKGTVSFCLSLQYVLLSKLLFPLFENLRVSGWWQEFSALLVDLLRVQNCYKALRPTVVPPLNLTILKDLNWSLRFPVVLSFASFLSDLIATIFSKPQTS